MSIKFATLTLATALFACTSHSDTTTTKTPTDAGATTFVQQASRGQELYGAHCASCHGSTGANGKAPALVGLAQGALPMHAPAGAARTGEFVTVADIAQFAVAAMPPAAPGSLSQADYWAILAFDLQANGIVLEEPLTPELAQGLTIPR